MRLSFFLPPLLLPATGYGSDDGGTLLAQAPAGNANGDLEVEEYLLCGGTDAPQAPSASAMLSLYPNPFNPLLRIQVRAEKGGHLATDIFDVSGRHLLELADCEIAAGITELAWNGRDDNGTACPSGVYLVRATVAGEDLRARAVLLK